MMDEREKSSQRIIDLDRVLLLLVLSLNTAIGLAYILSFQVGMPTNLLNNVLKLLRLALLMLDALYIVVFLCRKGKIFGVCVKVCLFLAYTFFVAMTVYRPSFLTYVLAAFPWPMTFIVYYLYSREKEFSKVYRVLLVLCHFALCLVSVRSVLTRNAGTNVGPIYHTIVFLPMILLLCKKKSIVIMSTLLVFAIIVLSAKRTGLLALVIGYCGFFMVRTMIQETVRKRVKSMIAISVLGVLALAVGLVYIKVSDSNVIDRFESISEDQGSGRFGMWEEILTEFKGSSLQKKVFGHGIHAVPNKIRPFDKYIFAHNSYVEFLYDLGIIGVGALILVVLGMGWVLIRLIKEKDEMAPAAFFVLAIVLFFSLASYCFEESNYILMLASCWGAIMGANARKKEDLKWLFDRKNK